MSYEINTIQFGDTIVMTHSVSFGAHSDLPFQLTPGSREVAVASESKFKP